MSGYRYAFSLSSEEVKKATPPGTVRLYDHDLERTVSGHDRTVDHIRLVPRPSSDPNDPLRWPMWLKIASLCSVSLYSFVANFTSSALAPALPILAATFRPPQTFASLTHLIAVNVLFLGVANLFWIPLARVFGKRPILLLATLILTLSTMWCGLATSFSSLLAARAIQGIGGGAADAVAPDVVGDIFFVHQRGRAMAVYTVFLALGSTVGSTSGSYIAGNLGWRYTSWIGLALSAASFLFILLFVPETSFDRPTESPESAEEPLEKTGNSTHVEDVTTPVSSGKGILSLLWPFGRYRGSLATEFVRPWLTLRLPGVWLVMLHYGGLVGGIVTMSTVGPQLVAVPPYLWGNNSGLINLGGIIGTILGAIYTYFVADLLMEIAAKRRQAGLAEPESRLPSMIPSLFITTAGMLVYGFCGNSPGGSNWVGLQFGLGMVCFGLLQVPSIGFNYIIDSYGALAGDCFVMIVGFRAVISFAWTFFVGDWVSSNGTAEPFGIFGMLMGLFSLLLIPQWIYGKRTRIVTAKWVN